MTRHEAAPRFATGPEAGNLPMVSVSIFGRATPVELDFEQVESVK